jgi:RND family efflux transporter MFP subunit
MKSGSSCIGLTAACALALGLAGCRRAEPQQRADQLPTLNVTHWTDMSELYMEYPPLVAGQSVHFAVHLTRMNDFKPLTAGRPRIEMTPSSGGAPMTIPGSEPSRPGAFRVEGAMPPAGIYRWTLHVDAPDVKDAHDLGTVTVFADEASAVIDAEKAPGDDPTAISYLKEQQWTNEFATERVRAVPVRKAVRVPAVIEPATSGDVVVSAPVAGRFVAASGLSVGQTVRRGQALGRLEPRLADSTDRASLQSEVAEATAAVEAAKAELQRAERLFAEQAVPQRRVEDARRATTVTDARLEAARARLAQRDETLRTGGGVSSGNTFSLTAPIAGRIVTIDAVSGGSYDAGTSLMRIVRIDRVRVSALASPADVIAARSAAALSFEAPGSEPVDLSFDQRHDSGVLDPETRALSVHFDVANPNGVLLVGQSGTAMLWLRSTEDKPVVPRSAVLMEAGRPYVFVQVGGERFVRRFVEIDSRDGDRVATRSGLNLGDRVVTKGAYEVQLASAAKGLPAEGHVH